ncbi:MAG: selenium metabolism-associated LysR family transcriptional regulator [Lachnospirales bacterium]
MQFKQLEAFEQVIKQNSFSKAAKTLYLSQSTVSMHINSLEEELGCTLIIRSSKGVYPSEIGKLFYKYVNQILRLLENAENEVSKYNKNKNGHIYISASSVPSTYILPKLLTKFTSTSKDIQVTMINKDSVEVINSIENMETELGISGYHNIKSNCIFEKLCNDELVIITPNTEKYQNLNGDITKEVLQDETYILREIDSGTYKQHNLFLEDIGIDNKKIKIAFNMNSTESIVNAVSYGAGISIVSKRAVENKINSNDLLFFTFENPFLNRDIYLVTHKYVPLSPIGNIFREFILEYFKEKNI